MVVKLRLSPHRLLPNSPQKVYRLVAINSPKSRDSAPLETLGVYDAVPRHVPSVPRSERSLLDEGKEVQKEWVKRTEWDAERIKYWLGTGAQPSRRVAWLLHKANLIPPGRVFYGYRGPSKEPRLMANASSSSSTSQAGSQPIA